MYIVPFSLQGAGEGMIGASSPIFRRRYRAGGDEDRILRTQDGI